MKYRLRLDLPIQFGSVKMYRIERLSDSTLGGYIEKESNLSQAGKAWVSGEAMVYGNAMVYGDAMIYGDAKVSGEAMVYDNAKVYGYAWVSGEAMVYGNAMVYGDAMIYGDAKVYGDAQIENHNEIINIIINFKFSITITPDNIVIGCQLKKRSEWLKVNVKEAKDMGLEPELFKTYQKLVKAGMKLVPERKSIL